MSRPLRRSPRRRLVQSGTPGLGRAGPPSAFLPPTSLPSLPKRPPVAIGGAAEMVLPAAARPKESHRHSAAAKVPSKARWHVPNDRGVTNAVGRPIPGVGGIRRPGKAKVVRVRIVGVMCCSPTGYRRVSCGALHGRTLRGLRSAMGSLRPCTLGANKRDRQPCGDEERAFHVRCPNGLIPWHSGRFLHGNGCNAMHVPRRSVDLASLLFSGISANGDMMRRLGPRRSVVNSMTARREMSQTADRCPFGERHHNARLALVRWRAWKKTPIGEVNSA
jgi:hypothetical protein